MQTPGLPSHPSTSRNTADNYFSDKPSHATEQFGDLMNRALHSGPGILPVRPETRDQNVHTTPIHTTEHDTDKKSSSVKSKKSLHRASDNQSNADNSASANPHFLGLVSPNNPASVPTPNQPSDDAHASPAADDSVTLISGDSTDSVADANATETEADKSAAKPLPAGMQPQAAETTASVEHQQNAPSAELTGDLAAQLTEATADPAESALSGDSTPPSTETADSKSPIGSVSASPANPHGTSAAKQDVTMKKAEKMQKVAGSGEQDLPGNSTTGSEELPQGQKISEKAASHGEKAEFTPIELPTRVSTSVSSPSATITNAAPTPPSSIDSRVLERTHDIVALHAMRLTDTGAQSLHVVVKPGGGIQISLELRQSARGIEVNASLHKGDYDQLSQHWPDLQQRLEARGVRVGTLTPSENYTGTGHHFHQSKQQSSQQESLHAGAFAEFALAGSMTEPPAARAARASAYRGWETWA
jgi:hypothetical protein